MGTSRRSEGHADPPGGRHARPGPPVARGPRPRAARGRRLPGLYDTVETLVPGGARLDVRATQTPDGTGHAAHVGRTAGGAAARRAQPRRAARLRDRAPAHRRRALRRRVERGGARDDSTHQRSPFTTTSRTARRRRQFSSRRARSPPADRQPATWDLDTLLDTLDLDARAGARPRRQRRGADARRRTIVAEPP